MSWPSITKDRVQGFKPKHETDFLRIFYKNVKPEGMDKFRSVVLDQQLRCAGSSEKYLSNTNEINVKNSLNTRLKIYSKVAHDDKIGNNPYKSQYEIYAMLNTAGRQ